MQYNYKSSRIEGLDTKRGKKTSKKYKKRNKEDIMQIDIEDEKIMNVMSDQH